MATAAPRSRGGSAPILLVDDRPANLLALEAILSSPDYELVRAVSGAEALAEFEQRAFAVVLLDVQMPMMDGVETASKMSQLGTRLGWEVPIIFVTGIDSDRARILSAYASGAVDFIQKPLEPEVIRSKVSVFVALHRAKQRLLDEIEEGERLRDALRAREELLAVVAHDIRSPLSAVLIAAHRIEHFAEGSAHAPMTKKAVGSIVRIVHKTSRLVEDLLDLARLEAGQPLPLEMGTHELGVLIHDAAELIEPLASAKQLTLRKDLEASLEARCDGARVEQVLGNLIGNAIKFTPQGGTIQVAARRDRTEIVVSVTDDGPGIPDEKVPHIFDRYWQADPGRRRGVGLGLSIVKAIVDAHGGRLWVHTALGRGTSFHFTLPVVGDAREASASAASDGDADR